MCKLSAFLSTVLVYVSNVVLFLKGPTLVGLQENKMMETEQMIDASKETVRTHAEGEFCEPDPHKLQLPGSVHVSAFCL